MKVINFDDFEQHVIALIDLNTVPPHMRTDYAIRNENIEKGRTLCSNCDGTGNNLFYTYQKCLKCNGDGCVKQEVK